MQQSENEKDSMPAERKLSIIMEEWRYVQGILRDEADRKIKVRTWAITAFSASLGLSIYQNNAAFALFSIPAVLLFWYIDTVRQGTMEVLYKRNYKIEQVLQNASDATLLSFDAPLFGHMLGNTEERRALERLVRFGKVRRLFFGSMVFASVVIFLLLFLTHRSCAN